MKSQRRHELRTNELADSLSHLFERAKANARPLAYAGVLVLALVVVLFVYPRVRGKREAGVAAQFSTALYAGDVQSMRDFLTDHPGAPQTPLARLALADRLLDEAVRGVTVAQGEDAKAKAARCLAEAKDLYAGVAKEFPEHEGLARVGLALVAVQEGDLAQGTAMLDGIGRTWPDSPAAAKARIHLQALAGYKPVPFSNEPLEGPKPLETPEGPGAAGSESPGAETPKAETPKTESPKTETPEPSEPKPEGNAPADTKPKG